MVTLVSTFLVASSDRLQLALLRETLRSVRSTCRYDGVTDIAAGCYVRTLQEHAVRVDKISLSVQH